MPTPPRPPLRVLALFTPVLLLSGCSSQGRSTAMREREAAGLPAASAGMTRFLFDDFGGLTGATLQTNALPFKVVATALVMEEERGTGEALGRDDLPGVFRRFGFLTPRRVANWNGPPVRFDRPMGMVTGVVEGPTPLVRVDAATLGCAACHAGALWDAGGAPTPEVAWMGLPNTSLNVEAYTRAVYGALKRGTADPEALERRVRALFPEMGRRERWTLRYALLPRARKRMAELSRGIDGPTPYPNGGAGRTNGVAALKGQLGLLPATRVHPEYAFTSIPEISGRALRSSLLYDGTFAPRGEEPFRPRTAAEATPEHAEALGAIVAFFTVPTMGVDPDRAEEQIPAVREAVSWLAFQVHSPPFPGPIDEARAGAGARLFAARCSGCHGEYAAEGRPRRLVRFPNRLVPQAEMGTDPVRWRSIDDSTVALLGRTAYARHLAVRRTGGYVAPILSGVWATAPYLHNGSVPTLWQLMTPAERPVRFQVGGHRLDYEELGIDGATGADGVYRYPQGYRPWTEPELYDSRRPGMGNGGHEGQFAGLSEEEKRALIEYLKTL